MKHRFHFARVRRAIGVALALFLSCGIAITAGCARPMERYRLTDDEPPLPLDFKRRESYPQLDFFHRFGRQVYKPAARIEYFLPESDSQRLIMEQLGLPDYVRKPFFSKQGEKVDEWLYMDNLRLFQFVRGEPVFEGPVTDHEIVLMQRGYPSRVEFLRTDTESTNITFVYNGFWGGGNELFRFHNDDLVIGIEDN